MKIARIETFVQELSLVDLRRVPNDIVVQRFVEHTLQLASQAAIDVAAHIVSDEHLGAPQTQGELFMLLARHGWTDSNLAHRLARMAGFRNLLVHKRRADADRPPDAEEAELDAELTEQLKALGYLD